MPSCERLKDFLVSQITGIEDDERKKPYRINKEMRERLERLKIKWAIEMTPRPENRCRTVNY
ncbi:MAG TPA: hypothetical protein VMW04_02885 [Patescibacteria group bacterium]|nr:hypothetical protein [Patescibacteria group bacterium]